MYQIPNGKAWLRCELDVKRQVTGFRGNKGEMSARGARYPYLLALKSLRSGILQAHCLVHSRFKSSVHSRRRARIWGLESPSRATECSGRLGEARFPRFLCLLSRWSTEMSGMATLLSYLPRYLRTSRACNTRVRGSS